MKLLKLEIGDLPKEKQFRSLHAGFKVEFHSLDTKGIKAMESFSPFCFAGLNGSGKSNVLEALSAIFFHMECCVAKYLPNSLLHNFKQEQCHPDAFILEYLISLPGSSNVSISQFNKITITKEDGKTPKMVRQPFPFVENETFKVSMEPNREVRPPLSAEAKVYLPDILVGYSSGENQTLSIPFLKSRLLNLDQYDQDFRSLYRFKEPENSLIYIDESMSQAVLLTCLLFEDEQTLRPLREELGLIDIKSFRLNFNNHDYLYKKREKVKFPENDNEYFNILGHLENEIQFLKNTSTCWHKFVKNDDYPITLSFDFLVDDELKKAFRSHFKNPFDFFRLLQVFYELNNWKLTETEKKEIYNSKGYYTEGKVPEPSPDDKVFYFLDYFVLRELPGYNEPKEMLLREFSDGEHQFLHTLGICIMLKNKRSLLLLDEPETHFNPQWRANYIKILGETIYSNNENSIGMNLLMDIILTSHSPFIISDCMPNNVLFFTRNEETKLVDAKKASELGLKTYGSSVDYILKNFFKTNLISNKSFEELKEIIDHGTIDELRNAVEDFGESSEKQFLFRKIYEKM